MSKDLESLLMYRHSVTTSMLKRQEIEVVTVMICPPVPILSRNEETRIGAVDRWGGVAIRIAEWLHLWIQLQEVSLFVVEVGFHLLVVTLILWKDTNSGLTLFSLKIETFLSDSSFLLFLLGNVAQVRKVSPLKKRNLGICRLDFFAQMPKFFHFFVHFTVNRFPSPTVC